MSVKDDVRKNLEAFMSFAGVKQTQLAKELGLTRATISNWINGRTSIDIEYIPNICSFLGITIQELFGEMPDEDSLMIASAYKTLDNDEKREVRDFIMFLRWRR